MATRKTAADDPTRNPKKLPLDPVGQVVQQAMNEATEKGFLGDEVDPTPNSAYTLTGVLAGEPTPETDKDAAKAAREASNRA